MSCNERQACIPVHMPVFMYNILEPAQNVEPHFIGNKSVLIHS